jgi:hypothetical protein
MQRDFLDLPKRSTDLVLSLFRKIWDLALVQRVANERATLGDFSLPTTQSRRPLARSHPLDDRPIQDRP